MSNINYDDQINVPNNLSIIVKELTKSLIRSRVTGLIKIFLLKFSKIIKIDDDLTKWMAKYKKFLFFIFIFINLKKLFFNKFKEKMSFLFTKIYRM
jgi:hypothetical protein